MNNLFKEFKHVSKSEWKDKIIKDLKGKGHDLLEFHDPVEGISFNAYYHQEDLINKNDIPGNYPFERGFNRPLNKWNNTVFVNFQDDDFANQHALKLLMSGADAIWFSANKEKTDWKKVLDEIQLDCISTQFDVHTVHEYREISLLFEEFGPSDVMYNFDAHELYENKYFDELSERLKEKQQRVILVNGFGIQQAGASSSEEIAFCLSMGHQIIADLMDKGLSIDDAAACIHFHIGVGSNYFLEIVKVKALKELWAKIIKAYNPEHECSYNMTITGIVGHMNKSLADPYTNLLRQTTETLSALNGGVDHICVLPYDMYAANGSSELAARMAMNIPLILKEESYIDKVIDPTAGSYSMDHLYDVLGRKAWSLFQELESLGGIRNDNALNSLKDSILTSRNKRTELVLNGDSTLIGINKYSNPDESVQEWLSPEAYLEIEPLILELEYKTVDHAS